MPVQDGDTVSLNYTGRLKDGQVFDTSEGREPLTFQVGKGMVIPGFDDGVRGLEKGEAKTLEIPPEQGYGEHDPNLVREIGREQLDAPDLEAGQVLGLETEDGRRFQATVRNLDEEKVELDFNHFLAGKTLVFDIEVIDHKSG